MRANTAQKKRSPTSGTGAAAVKFLCDNFAKLTFPSENRDGPRAAFVALTQFMEES